MATKYKSPYDDLRIQRELMDYVGCSVAEDLKANELLYGMLIAQCRWAKFWYYQMANNIVSDTIYDLWEESIKEIEAKYPQLIRQDAPTRYAGCLDTIIKEVDNAKNNPV